MALLSEHIDGKYEILEKIREGGMGAIYKVRHRLLDEVRVVKVIRSQADTVGEAADRFLSEARSAIKLRHPNVAVLHDFAMAEDGQAFIVMEFIEGWNLLEILNGFGPPPIPLTLEIARQSLKALGYLHRRKIVHRDVSPDNLMLTRDVDGNPLIKLIDLGIAKTLEGQGGMTTTGVFLGKPRYGSPERFSGDGWDERSDLYSFGVVLYELLTLRCPITGNDPASLMAGHLFRPPLDFAETDPQGRVPAELRKIVLKALAKKPDERVASAEDFIWELTMLQDRYPLRREELEGVWQALLPLGTGRTPAADRPGSTQDRLDLEFGLATTPPAGTQAATLRAVSPLTERLPSEPTRRVTPAEDLDSTWASRPLRKEAGPAAEPAPPPPAALRAGAVAKTSRGRVVSIAAGVVAVLALAAGGFWMSRPSTEPQPAAPLIPVTETIAPASVPVSTLEEPQAAPPVQEPAAEPVAPPLKPEPEKPRAAPVPLEPMKPGDLIQASQPGVEPPEAKEPPSYSYPEEARGSGKESTIRVLVLVDENGAVIDARVREGDSLFHETALEAARKVRFFPPSRDGVPGKMWTDLLLEFSER
ncbi:MAG TPA: TonB family protein [Thermoanaerobaculia bacterium]|nr:TonB family protein [Thermoanaerobaculia bacterium]